eukprot:TRINITY_DN8005_c1_g1_i1.p1 TRINITY_DN8005_c1_g1~~TRINITY_DN8005_c1_g1_i1.p1  ORF type:complete len:355 (-),score=-30.24 TRINITY_DN8005_c1_g1_i1:544-1608(-)
MVVLHYIQNWNFSQCTSDLSNSIIITKGIINIFLVYIITKFISVLPRNMISIYNKVQNFQKQQRTIYKVQQSVHHREIHTTVRTLIKALLLGKKNSLRTLYKIILLVVVYLVHELLQNITIIITIIINIAHQVQRKLNNPVENAHFDKTFLSQVQCNTYTLLAYFVKKYIINPTIRTQIIQDSLMNRQIQFVVCSNFEIYEIHMHALPMDRYMVWKTVQTSVTFSQIKSSVQKIRWPQYQVSQYVKQYSHNPNTMRVDSPFPIVKKMVIIVSLQYVKNKFQKLKILITNEQFRFLFKTKLQQQVTSKQVAHMSQHAIQLFQVQHYAQNEHYSNIYYQRSLLAYVIFQQVLFYYE